VLKPDGSLWVSGTYHNIFAVGHMMREIGFWQLGDVQWIKNNPAPNFNGTRLCSATETLIWAIPKKDAKYTFNYWSAKNASDDKQMRNDWYIPICGGAERLKIDGKKAHSTQKPEALLRRIIAISSNPQDTVLDPFFGSGTTGAVAKAMGRNYIGIERELRYIHIAQERIDKVNNVNLQTDMQLFAGDPKPEMRVSFGVLVENGFANAGDVLVSTDQKHQVVVTVDGNVLMIGQNSTTIKVSIHQSAKQLSGGNENGWHYWQLNGVSIDDLRKKYRTTYYE
jgi:modification methylase